jgi:hypothetical protein
MNGFCGAAALALATQAFPTVASAPTSDVQCRADGPPARLAALPEASGLTASHRIPNRLWAINDSGAAILFALDARGAVVARVPLASVAVDDWEAIAVGPCDAGSCLYVGDIGDNRAKRKEITIYRIREPTGAKASAQVLGAIHAVYPDGPQDAESLLATPGGDLYIVTKGSTGPIALYRVPRESPGGSTVRLERLGQPREPGKIAANDRITDGAVSPDGEWIVLRTHRAVLLYRTARLLAGNWREERAIDLEKLGEHQGEGVTFGSDGSLYLAGEGGGNERPGTLVRLLCGW